MSLETGVKKLLNLPLDFINFNFYGHRITAGSFAYVAKEIGKAVKVKEGTSADWAWYDPGPGAGGTLFTSKAGGDSKQRLALVLHECVHAYHDLKGESLRAVADEACAYIAQGMFLHHHGTVFEGALHPVDRMASFYLLHGVVKKGKKPSAPGKALTREFVGWLNSRKLDDGTKAYQIKEHRTYNG